MFPENQQILWYEKNDQDSNDARRTEFEKHLSKLSTLPSSHHLLSKANIQSLEEGSWVHGDVIDFFGTCWSKLIPSVMYLPTCIGKYLLLTNDIYNEIGQAKLDDWIPKIFSRIHASSPSASRKTTKWETILIPLNVDELRLNEKGSHWRLLEIDLSQRKLFLWDSMEELPSSAIFQKVLSRLSSIAVFEEVSVHVQF
mmetsp:Transcript_25812/g.65180  ORF Transcript_25812/g.65180 Transcript_25812/m.65180 type:complete len:198 (+) Transcript_25812:820-1413(+)